MILEFTDDVHERAYEFPAFVNSRTTLLNSDMTERFKVEKVAACYSLE